MRILADIAARPPAARPRLWFTYHVYYKAPDWIGPAVAGALGIPYVVAEGSRAGKRAAGPFALGHEGAEAALDTARVLLVMTGHDRVALARARTPDQVVADLPPFVAAPPAADAVRSPGPPRLIAVGMMREGDKLASYRLLADTLAALRTPDWTLGIAGDGPLRAEVAALLAPFGERVRLHGALDGPALASLYARADLLVWPAVNEAYGMALLEAQVQGCPVVAGGYGGVRDALRDGVTGLVVPPGEPGALARAVDDLLADPPRRAAMAAAARRFAREERSVPQAAARLRAALLPLLDTSNPSPSHPQPQPEVRSAAQPRRRAPEVSALPGALLRGPLTRAPIGHCCAMPRDEGVGWDDDRLGQRKGRGAP